jgi:hypothetical protein
MATTTTPRNNRSVREQIELIQSVIGGKVWGLHVGKPRIYMNTGRRDITAYYDFADATYKNLDADDKSDPVLNSLGGASLRIFIKDCGQHAGWYRSQWRMIMNQQSNIANAVGLATSIYSSGECLSDEEITNAMREVMSVDMDDAEIDRFAHECINARWRNALEFARGKKS